ncbi:MAG: TspO/MBR family protein [Cytophagales bacterium]
MNRTYTQNHSTHKTAKFRSGVFFSCLLLCVVVSGIGYFLTKDPVRYWYPLLDKPALNPPNWVFGPVWTVLYTMMAVAWYNIRIKPLTTDIKVANTFFIIQLIFNALWSYSFFTLQSPILGLVTIAILWLLILFTSFLFFRQSKFAGWLMVPYLLWVSFASYLNFTIWLIN